MENLQILWSSLLLVSFEIQRDQVWPLHMIASLNFMQSSPLTLNKGFRCCELVLAAVGFEEVEFILLYTPLTFGYMCIAFVLFLNLMVWYDWSFFSE